MNTKKILKIFVGVVVVVISLPVLLGLIIVVWVSTLNQTNGAIVSSGETREYLLYVPRSYDRAKSTPLVISMHAAMNWPAFQMKLSQWNKGGHAWPGGKPLPKWIVGTTNPQHRRHESDVGVLS